MKKHTLIRSFTFGIVVILTGIFCSGCLQKDFDYEGRAIDPNINMTTWEFLQSRPDLFSLMSEAITFAGMEEFYKSEQKKYTYLLINNVGMNIFLSKYGTTSAVTLDVNQVRKLLKYHIIEGEYHGYDKKLPVEPIFVKTLLEGEDGLLTIKISKSQISQATNQDQIINGNINVNDTGSNGSSPEILSVTSNVLTTNGAAHVFRKYAYYQRNSSYQPAF